MGADRLDTEQPQAAGASVVARKAKIKQTQQISDESFYEELSKLKVSKQMELNPLLESMINTSIQRIKSFSNSDRKKESCSKEEVIQLTNLVLQDLCGLVITIDSIFTAFLEEHSDAYSRISVAKMYKESKLSKIFLFLQGVIRNLIKKMNEDKRNFKMPDFFTMEEGVKVIKILPSDERSSYKNLSGGKLYILGDTAGPVPIYVEDVDLHRKAASNYIPYFGNFIEGMLTRGLIFAGDKLDPRPGVFCAVVCGELEY